MNLFQDGMISFQSYTKSPHGFKNLHAAFTHLGYTPFKILYALVFHYLHIYIHYTFTYILYHSSIY